MLAMAGMSAAADAGEAVRVEVVVTVGTATSLSLPEDADPAPAGLVLSWAGGRGDAVDEELALEVTVPGSVTVELPSGSLWTATLTTPSWWAAPTTVMASDESGRAEVVAWPRAAISGRVETPARAPAPQEILVEFHGSASVERQQLGEASGPTFEQVVVEADPRGEARCPVVEMAFRCSLPATTVDLRLRSEGFASVLVPRQELTPGVTRNLGTMTLVPGGSVLGRVLTVEGPAEPSSCTITLEPAPSLAMAPPSADDMTRRAAQRRTTRPDDRGYFVLDGLGAGSYVVTAEQPGFLPTSVGPLPVYEGDETQITQLVVLERPVDLEVQVAPPTTPEGAPWRLQGLPPTSALERPLLFDLAVPLDGSVIIPGLAPGLVVVTVRAAQGALLTREIEVRPLSPFVLLEVQAVEVCGTVRSGDLPVQGSVHFGGAGASPGAHLQADEDGRFAGLLPRLGSWTVQVRDPETGLDAVLRDVEVEEGDGGCSEVELRIPDSGARGVVIDEGGQTVEGATITMLDVDLLPLTFRQSEDDGTFLFRGITPGPVWLVAREERGDGARQSAYTQVEIPARGTAAPVELKLRERREVTGTVVGDGRPVVGARVTMTTDWDSLTRAASESAVTDADGRFRLVLPHHATRALAIVAPPPYALTVRLVELGEGSVADVILPVTVGGTLEIDVRRAVPATDAAVEPPRGGWLAWVDGLPLPPSELLGWARFAGVALDPASDRARIPQLAPGHYRACLFSSTDEAVAALFGAAPPNARCAEGFLPPGGLLRLELEEDTKSGATGD
jgi:hypothetical protein